MMVRNKTALTRWVAVSISLNDFEALTLEQVKQLGQIAWELVSQDEVMILETAIDIAYERVTKR